MASNGGAVVPFRLSDLLAKLDPSTPMALAQKTTGCFPICGGAGVALSVAAMTVTVVTKMIAQLQKGYIVAPETPILTSFFH